MSRRSGSMRWMWLQTLVLLAAPICIAQEAAPSSELSRYERSVKYAETRLQLAEVELRYAMEVNRKGTSSIPKLTIERLKSNLAIAREQFTEANIASAGSSERIRMLHAEEKIRLAKIDLESGQRLKKGGVMSGLELERLRLRYELAKQHAEVLKHPENFASMLHYLEKQVERMGDEILSLDQRIQKLEPVRGMLPKNQ